MLNVVMFAVERPEMRGEVIVRFISSQWVKTVHMYILATESAKRSKPNKLKSTQVPASKGKVRKTPRFGLS